MTPPPGEATLPAFALDADVMRRVFAGHAAVAATVRTCRVVRHRHRHGVRRIVQYALELADGRVCRVTGQWHAGAGRTAHLARIAIRRASPETATWTAPFPPVFFDHDAGMLATTFPWDRRLPALNDVAAGRCAAVLAPMLAATGASTLLGVTVETVRYREQLGAVCRYVLRVRRWSGDEVDARFYVKLYPDQAGANLARRLAGLAALTAATPGAARVTAPTGYVAERQALIVPQVPGEPLDRLVGQSDSPALWRQVGAALARFGALPAEREPPRELDGRRAVAALVDALPALAGQVIRVYAAADRRRRTPRIGLVHGDLKLEHILIDDHSVHLVDLDSAHCGDPRWDLALLEARRYAAAGREAASRDCSALADAYFAHSAAASAAGLAALRALARLDVAAGIVKRREPAWESTASRLVAAANDALEGAAP